MTEAARAPAHDTLIQESWSRCRDYGLTHQSSPRFDPPAVGELSALLESRQALVQTTHQEVLPYYGTILANSNCLIMLADDQGRLLQSWGDQRFIEPRQAAGFVAGASWLERYTGTNAIGTALSCGQAVHIQHDEHFLKANRFMTGSASPIFDEQRRMIAVLDVSSDSYLPPAHTLGMVKMMSQSVENRLLLKLFADQYHLLSFNTSLDNLDSPWAGLVVFDEQGHVVSANRRADNLLGHALTYGAIEQLFDVPLQQLLNQPDGQPFSLRTSGHFRFHARVRRPARPAPIQPRDFRPQATPSTPQEPQLHTLSAGDARMDKAVRQAERLLEKDIPILIQGETGAGKEVFVKALHQASSRANQPFIAVNCAAIPAELVESELFGYEKGAFTGASQKGHVGLIRKAHKGTLFLDEIGDMPLRVQARLLRVLQERCVQPLGSSELHPVDVRLVSATNRPLRQDVDSGQFRADLYYRISGLNLELPPLRERSDKQALFQRLWEQHREPHQRAGISREVLELFQHHPWPGNLRQLSSVLRVALAMADDQAIRAEHLPDDFFLDLPTDTTLQARPEPDDLASQYQACGGNISYLARHLGLSRNTLYKRLREQGVRP
ncbi:sigma-54-dependent Fis family transcriptional regulator [Ectopseudomonas alcaliphila]|uniref:GAF modulated sigma54 specific transcriptional regulator, Fis family n=1 Tax=Ectopseudomonas alcaliphila TaxID=101564 RepID=A0A1G7DSR8_9GAMM|nr:sigma-54-dependent Fis family transcriptional regulator [Pseudomonas alcaliphila]MDX5990588.1 sigma-54-dependent Fis family transcriptional regulator [Pseudomonas alcaliphila]SDE54554.1 GAF modulated sigma54 specific transcriptional regulator, Fis family [Pseudomonas alcaliphila]